MCLAVLQLGRTVINFLAVLILEGPITVYMRFLPHSPPPLVPVCGFFLILLHLWCQFDTCPMPTFIRQVDAITYYYLRIKPVLDSIFRTSKKSTYRQLLQETNDSVLIQSESNSAVIPRDCVGLLSRLLQPTKYTHFINTLWLSIVFMHVPSFICCHELRILNSVVSFIRRAILSTNSPFFIIG